MKALLMLLTTVSVLKAEMPVPPTLPAHPTQSQMIEYQKEMQGYIISTNEYMQQMLSKAYAVFKNETSNAFTIHYDSDNCGSDSFALGPKASFGLEASDNKQCCIKNFEVYYGKDQTPIYSKPKEADDICHKTITIESTSGSGRNKVGHAKVSW